MSEFCSDDGEPSGTSGRPLLAVVKGSGMGDIAVVVSRYFGGTLLGTGGLVKAYSQAGKLVVSAVRRASLTPATTVSLNVSYEIFDRVRRLLDDSKILVLNEKFAETVSLEACVVDERLAEFRDRLAGVSSGSLIPSVIGHGEIKIPLEGGEP